MSSPSVIERDIAQCHHAINRLLGINLKSIQYEFVCRYYMSMSFSWHLSLSILGTKDCFEDVGAVITLMNTGNILSKTKIDKVLNFTGLYFVINIKFPNFRHLKWKKLLP